MKRGLKSFFSYIGVLNPKYIILNQAVRMFNIPKQPLLPLDNWKSAQPSTSQSPSMLLCSESEQCNKAAWINKITSIHASYSPNKTATKGTAGRDNGRPRWKSVKATPDCQSNGTLLRYSRRSCEGNVILGRVPCPFMTWTFIRSGPFEDKFYCVRERGGCRILDKLGGHTDNSVREMKASVVIG